MKRYEAEVFLGDDKSGHWDSLDAYLCTDVDALLAQCEEALEAWEDLEGYIPPLALYALDAIRAAREDSHDK